MTSPERISNEARSGSNDSSTPGVTKGGVTVAMTSFVPVPSSVVAQIEALKARTGAQRVAGFLLELCEAEKGPATVVLPYDKNLIAGRLGMKPESLSRAFSRLRRDAGVRVAANVATIRDVEALQRFAIRDPALAWSRSG